MRIFKTLLILTIAFLVSNPLWVTRTEAVESKRRNTKLDQVLKSARAAVGSEKAIQKIRNIRALAACTGPTGKYVTEIHSFRSNKTYFKQTFTYKIDDSEVFINDSLAWNTPENPYQPHLLSPFERLVVNLHEYQRMAFDFQTLFSGFSLIDENYLFENRASVKVRAKTAIGTDIFLYFDTQTKLLSGYVLPIPGSKTSVKNVFNEWKKIEKVRLPSKITAIDPSGMWVLKFNKIILNKADERKLDVPSQIKDLAELLRLHKQHQTAHLTYNAELFIESFAEKLPQLQKGRVLTGTKAENLARFKKYFSSYKFLEWEDINPPIIKISKDGTLATKIVEKRVRGTYKNEKGDEETDHTVFAWLEVWEKIGGKWKVSAVASTSRTPKN